MFDPRKMQVIKNISNIKEFNGSMRQAIKAAGYSQTIADNPKVLTDRKWFKASLPTYAETSEELKNLMYASRLDHYVFPLSLSDDEIREIVEGIAGCRLRKIKHGETQTWAYFYSPDNKSKKEAIDIVLKVRGDYAAEKHAFVDPLEGITDEEALDRINHLKTVIEIRRVRANGQ